jgi:glyoxylase-like metal-dependent hydrolase (beta-lactamase superfamily II)
MILDKIGEWDLRILETGDFKLDGGAMMGSVPKVLWSKTNPSDDKNRIDLSMRCLLLDNGKRRVLIETGIGDHCSEKFAEIFQVDQKKNALSKALSHHGYINENITDVILTHLHFDHAGGAVLKNSDGNMYPRFPNATYYISQTNWDAGMNPSPKDKASYLKENYICLKDQGVLEIIPDNVNIVDGIDTYTVNGHTHGQQLVKISSNDSTIVFCSDLIPLKSHIKVPWIMGYDLNAELTMKEKEIFLKKASDEGWILFLYHDPEVAAVKIDMNNNNYRVIDELRRKKN